MIFDKIRKILESIASVFIPKGPPPEKLNLELERLEKRKQLLIEEKKKLIPKSIDWYRLDAFSQKNRDISIFQKSKFIKIPTLKSIKQERIKAEREKQIALENSILAKLKNASQLVQKGLAFKADYLLKQIQPLLPQTKKTEIHELFATIHSSVLRLKKINEEQERLRILEERKKQEEEERLKQEAHERDRKEKEAREREAREKRKAESNKFILEARRKEEDEMAERRRLEALCSEIKDDASQIKSTLRKEGVLCFYHFTNINNIPSIKKHKGLFSWHYCNTHNITISSQGGNALSRQLDTRYRLQDYVRLSFCDDHPMAYRLQQNGECLVLLKIKIDVALFKKTLFSDINATDMNHCLGGEYEDLLKVDFDATKRHFIRHTDNDFKPHQAEVLVKTFIPLNCILNIDNPRIMHK